MRKFLDIIISKRMGRYKEDRTEAQHEIRAIDNYNGL